MAQRRGIVLFLGIGTGAAVAAAVVVRSLFFPPPLSPSAVTESQAREMGAHLFAAMDARFTPSPRPLPPVPAASPYDRVYVSILRDRKLRCCMSGAVDASRPDRFGADLDDAVARCLRDDRYGGPLTAAEAADAEIDVSLLYGRRAVSGFPDALATQLERGVHALELEREGRSTFFVPSVPITKNHTTEQMVRRLCRKAKLEEECFSRPDTHFFLHDALTFRARRDGGVTFLYRDNPLLPPAALTPALLRERLLLAERWFAAHGDENGLPAYEYLPSKDRYTDASHDVRQLAAGWSMASLGTFLGSDALAPQVARIVRHYRERAVCEEEQACRIDTDGRGALAATAFLLHTLLDLPDSPENVRWRELLALGILREQREDGSFRTFHGSDTSSNADYYPGEAMFALLRLHRRTGDGAYLDAVRKAFPYYRAYWRSNRNTAFVPWHTQAYRLLYEATGDPEFAAFVFEMNDWLIENHQIAESPFPDLTGAFRRGKPGYVTSVYTEGLADAFAVAERAGDAARAERYRASVRRAVRFILLSQLTPENAHGLPNPDRAVGGFRNSLVNNAQRIDYTQHAVMAIMKSLKNGVWER